MSGESRKPAPRSVGRNEDDFEMIGRYPDLPPSDFGLGSAYERYALYGWLRATLKKWNGAAFTGVEGFYDSFAGLPGLHLMPLAEAGGHVTVACRNQEMAEKVRGVYDRVGLLSRLQTVIAREPDALAGRQFDLAFLFNPFPFVEDWTGLLAQTAKLSTRYLLVSVCSRNSYGIIFRRLLKKIRPSSGEGLDLFDHSTSDQAFFRRHLGDLGKVTEEVSFDAPWWPDFYGGPGDTVLSWMLKQVGAKPNPTSSKRRPPNNHCYGLECFPYFEKTSEALRNLEKKLSRHPTFDHLPEGLIKSFFAHHRIFVVRR
jgi:hypothetical protein